MTKMSQSEAPAAVPPDAQVAARSGAPGAAQAAFVYPLVLLLGFLMPPAARCQALPAAEASPISTGFTLPRIAGTLQYAVSASESLSWGYYGNSGTDSVSNVSGDIAYLSGSTNYPFSMIFSGGRGWSTSLQPSYNYLNLALSQVINAGRWNFVVSDGVSYLPSTPTTGLSGVPGVGDLSVDPVQVGDQTGQGVLTNYSARVGNIASGSLQRQLTGKTSVQGSGSYSITRFVGNSANGGLSSDVVGGSGGLSHRFDTRNTVSGNYMYSSYSYPSYANSSFTYGAGQPGYGSQTASLQYTRQLTRKLGINLSGGPQWTSIASSSAAPTPNLYASVAATYAGEFSHASMVYTRGTNSGSGVIGGAISNSVGGSASRTLDRVWNCAVSASYTNTGGLPSTTATPYTFHTVVAGAQASRALVRSLSVYGSYTLEKQSNLSVAVAADVYSGLTQVVGFGLTYSPSSIHFGRQ